MWVSDDPPYDGTLPSLGQGLWLEHLLSYEKYPPLQPPETYNLTQVIEQVKKAQGAGGSD
jgi:hypothetical protein